MTIDQAEEIAKHPLEETTAWLSDVADDPLAFVEIRARPLIPAKDAECCAGATSWPAVMLPARTKKNLDDYSLLLKPQGPRPARGCSKVLLYRAL